MVEGDDSRVQCRDCGYIAVRRRTTFELEEMPGTVRETGQMPNDVGVDRRFHMFDQHPVCFRRLADFSETSSIPQVEAALHQDRLCEGFTPWLQGYSPKEHLDRHDREEQRAYELSRDMAIKTREEERDVRAEARHEEQMKILRGQSADLKGQHYRELIVFGFLIGAATVVAGILDGLIGRGVDIWPF